MLENYNMDIRMFVWVSVDMSFLLLSPKLRSTRKYADVASQTSMYTIIERVVWMSTSYSINWWSYNLLAKQYRRFTSCGRRLDVERNWSYFAVGIERHDVHTRVIGLVPELYPTSHVVYPVVAVAEGLTYIIHMTVVPVLNPDLSLRVVAAGTIRCP